MHPESNDRDQWIDPPFYRSRPCPIGLISTVILICLLALGALAIAGLSLGCQRSQAQTDSTFEPRRPKPLPVGSPEARGDDLRGQHMVRGKLVDP